MFENLNLIFIIIGVGVLAFIVIIIALSKRYIRCSPDQIMVISGRVGKGRNGEARSSMCMHGGAKFIMPIIQEVHFLDLTPFAINIDLKNALSRQNIRVSVPATFTVGISTEDAVMKNAAERLLGQPLRVVENLAKEIIYGQLRLVIAQMNIEELNAERDKFMSSVSSCVEQELKKIGLKLINANITDISDESGYIEALGKEAEAKAINEAKKTVAERNRDGNTGEKNEKMQEAITIAERDREQREGVAKQNALAVAAEVEAQTKQRADVARLNAEAESAEAESAKNKRVAIAARNAEAISAENESKAEVALSEAKRLEVEAEAKARAVAAAKVQNAKALTEAYAAEEKAELARATRAKAEMQADVIVQAEIEKQRIEIAAEAEAESVRRKAKGEADAILARMEAEAEGIKLQLAKRAEAYTMLVRSAGGDSDAAVRLMMADKVEDHLKTQVEAIKGINIDKITVWDSMSGQDGSSTTSNFLNSMMKSIPPMKDVYDMIGVEMPANLGKEKAAPAKASATPTRPVSPTPAK